MHGIASTLHLRGDLLDAEQLHHLRATLYQQTDRLRRLVDQLLDLSRLEANAISISVINFPVRRRVEELVLMLAGDHVSEIDLRIDPALETVADPEAFDRIVSNLLTNALRYGKPPVSVDARQTDRHFRLAVEDRGEGVAGDFVPYLFERFARGDPGRPGVHRVRARTLDRAVLCACARRRSPLRSGDPKRCPLRARAARQLAVARSHDRQPGGDMSSATRLVDHVDRVVLPVRPSDPEEHAGPADEAQPALLG